MKFHLHTRDSLDFGTYRFVLSTHIAESIFGNEEIQKWESEIVRVEAILLQRIFFVSSPGSATDSDDGQAPCPLPRDFFLFDPDNHFVLIKEAHQPLQS